MLGPLEVIQLYDMKCKNKHRYRDCYFGAPWNMLMDGHGWALDVVQFHLSYTNFEGLSIPKLDFCYP
jgi:hypothetical protein